MMRSTGIIPAGGFGLAREPIAMCAESAPKSLLPGPPPVDMPYPLPLPLYPPPHAARPELGGHAVNSARRPTLPPDTTGLQRLTGKNEKRLRLEKAEFAVEPVAADRNSDHPHGP